MPRDDDDKRYPKMTDMQKFGYLLAGAFGFGAGYLFFSRRAFSGGYAEKHHYAMEDFSPREIEMGADKEMEHTRMRSIAKRIALDHLAEDPYYYRRKKNPFLSKEDFE